MVASKKIRKKWQRTKQTTPPSLVGLVIGAFAAGIIYKVA